MPDAEGVPVTCPFAGLRLKPPGSAPPLIDHVYPGVPPVALKVCVVYTALRSPFGREAEATAGAAITGTVMLCAADVTPTLSVT